MMDEWKWGIDAVFPSINRGNSTCKCAGEVAFVEVQQSKSLSNNIGEIFRIIVLTSIKELLGCHSFLRMTFLATSRAALLPSSAGVGGFCRNGLCFHRRSRQL